ncbi:Ubiquitin carboxyl-terminal hydrolase 64E [Portunus trituberculatus]|uniref:Ubiquitin carboxyl-terminal hydrolase 47 n=1 Tax=Portunus trituberculatus TaxID=210409 RepID=A0A5B7CR50_PORTR|nr:Ubiquitin carboxyl-terminal hydrolase 64E [Portunus trituberculatus]
MPCGGGDGGGGGSGGGGGGGAADRSTSGRSGGSSSGGGGTTSVAEEASTKVARVNAGSSTVQESSMAETTTTSRFSTATTKVKTIKIVKKTSPLIASAISDLNSRAEASLGGATPRRPLAGGSKKVVRSIKIQQETPTTTKTSNKDVSKANDGKVIDVKVKETKVEVVKVCDSNSKETSAAGLSTSSAVSSENTQEVPSKAVTVGNAQLSEIEASNNTGKVIPIIRKASPGPKQPSKVGTTGKASKSLNNAKEALRPKRQSSPLSKTEESVQTSQDAPQTERTRLPSESEKVAVEPSLNSTATENPENSKVATVSSSASVSSSSSVSSSASTASVSSNKTVKAMKVKKPAKTKKQESTEVAPDDTTTTTTTTTKDSQTSVQEATAVPEISVSGAAAASGDMPKIDINGEGEGNGEEDIPVTKRESGAVADWDPKDTEEPELDSVCVVVRDMSGYNASVNQVTLAMSTQSTCGQLMAEVGRRFKYDPDSFSLVLQCSNGEQVEVEKMEAERALAHARFRIEGSARNNLILCDLGGHPPRQTDDDDLTLGASASPSIVTIPPNSILNAALERSIISYDTPATTSDYSSYSSPLIKHDSGFVGLVNQAMTCYLNSLLQTLFMTPEFRNALYQWEFKGRKMKDYVKCLECGNERAREDTYLDIPLPIRPFGSTSAYKSVEEALRAFVSPEVLTGNNQYKCSRCDALCDAHKGLKFTRFPYLLTIHLMRFDFDYQTLHRIKLNDKVIFPDVLDLNHFVDGDAGLRGEEGGDKPASGVDDSSTTDSGSALDAEDASLENTSASLPESDNQEEDEGIDVSSSSAYNNERNRSWGAASGGGPYMYQLFSIMVHSGSASGGHYYAYIKDFTSGEWYCFNDQSVTKITYDDIRKTYGGSGSSRSGGYYSSWSYSANAYMLMYRQVDRERNVYSLTTEEFPQHITVYVEASGEEAVDFFTGSQMYSILDRYENTITLYCPLPDTSPAVNTITTITCATPSSTPTASPTAASTTLVLGNCSDGEDEGIADADSGTGSSHVNSDQSASEDSSLTSDSDRTLVGEPPEDRLSDTSNSPDYHNVSPPTDPVGAAAAATSATTAEAKGGDETGGGWGLPIFQDTDGAWGDDEKATPELKRYFRAEYFTEEDTGARMLRVWVDKRITIGQLKQEMQRWVGVSQDHFKLYKIYSNRMTESLTSYADNTRLSVRLGRALLPGEHRGKVYLLEPHNFEDPSKFLIDWVVRKGDTVANAKRAIVREVNARCPGMNLVPERVRLRKKSWKTPQAIYLDQHKFDDDITLFSNWELFLQVLDGPEQKTANVDELAIFVKRWRPSSHTTDPLTEIIIPEPTTSALRAKLSEVSEIPAENVEFAKGKGTFPCDMSVLDIPSELDWTPRTGQLDQRPLYIMDDGAMIYYRDKTEVVKELTEEQRRDLAVSENQRLNRESQYCPSSSFTPSTSSYSSLRSREKGLKIYLNHDD